MEEDFGRSVETGLKLSKRIYSGKDRFSSAPKPGGMERDLQTPSRHLPTAPMVYAVISDPGIVDNPDFPSYQPHVYGGCDPPALIPLQMKEIGMDLDCYAGSVFVSVRGSWRVHCVMVSRSCDCRLVIPMGEQGSILGVEVDVAGRSYATELVQMEENKDMEINAKNEDGCFLRPQMFSLTIPQVNGGSILSLKVSWFQQLLFVDGQFSLAIPFSFPEYITPFGNRCSKTEKIQLNINTGLGKEVVCKTASHPLKELRRQVGKLGFLYEAEVITWSSNDFYFSFMIFSSDIFGGVLLQSPSVHDFDQRDMFCLYLFPGSNPNRKVFRREVVFLVDISGSMRGKPLENVTNALSAALFQLTPADSFSIIAFNEETHLSSSSLEFGTKEMVESAAQWISENFVAGGGTNILRPLTEALDMLASTRDSIPQIFLITDGAVEDERNICHIMKTRLTSRGSTFPRISTFGIGSYCNHHFLRMLALIGRGHYDAAYDTDSIEIRMRRFFTTASAAILQNVTIDTFDHLDAFEAYPFYIPDLLLGYPLIVSGRYQGNFPNSLEAKGVLPGMNDFKIELKVQKTKDIPLGRVFAKQQIDLLTAQAWFSESKQLEGKVARISIQSGVPSEYTCMVLLQANIEKQAPASNGASKVRDVAKGSSKTYLVGLTVGFGSVVATAENIPMGFGEANLVASGDNNVMGLSCCNRVGQSWCCMCCIKTCSQINNDCAIVVTQLCTALSCFGCLSFCTEACCDGD